MVETPKKKGGKGRLLKVLLGFGFIIGLGISIYSNNNLLAQGYSLSQFAVYLPYALGLGAFVCFVLVIGGRKKQKSNSKIIAKGTVETPDNPSLHSEYLTIVRPCSEEGCPSLFHFGGWGKCGSNGKRPEHCRLTEKAFEELFSGE